MRASWGSSLAAGIAVISLAFIAGQVANAADQVYVPGLGDIMGAVQVHHAKLWFAGDAGNWKLAAYELDEIREAVQEAARYQPDFQGRPIVTMIRDFTAAPLAEIQGAVDAGNSARFRKAFDDLTAACNACHRGAEHGFIAITQPSAPPVTNQRFRIP